MATGGCRDCRARGIVYNNDGGQICFHSTELKAFQERQDDITDAELQDIPELIDFM